MRPLRLTVSLALSLVFLFVAATPAAAVDLIGTWHVLIHYKDTSTIHAERERWDDRIWVFAMEGSKLRWTEYPIVVFNEQGGRFEPGAGGRMARTLDFWEPTAGQQAEIEAGLQINPRGSKNKSLRGDMTTGFSSAKRKGGYQSARFITFTETWSIEGLPDKPVFTFDDVMGSASTESFEGRTQYATETVEPGGNVLRGSFQRDENRKGTFRLQRAGSTRVVEGTGETLTQRNANAFMAATSSGMMADDFADRLGELPPDLKDLSSSERAKLEKTVRHALEDGLRAQGNTDLRGLQPELQNLSKRIVDELVDGKTPDQIAKMFRDGKLPLR